ncbi:MAG: hypothetical protein JO170_01720 [Verrucomicrobia bacterium]|nr:hypothetical protein [Verrucomicrobiota bacterium]
MDTSNIPDLPLNPDFTGPEHRRESTTRDIPELGISESISLTEYFPFRVRTPK